MAEIAGLVIGVVGVAGVIGAFKDAVDLFNLVADSRNLGREFEILDTKLDIEKALLLQWADGVGLIRAGLYRAGTRINYDTRLDDGATQTVIIRALNCIEALLSNAPDLKQRYGLTEAPEGSQDLATTRTMLSSPRWERFRANYRHWQQVSEARRAEHEDISTMKRIRWVIRDREKFERLIQEVGHFTAKIREILPVQASGDYVREDVEATRDLRQLKILQEASTGRGSSSAISETVERIIVETCKDRVLARLWFRKIDDRRESITTAHQRTLEWALQPNQNLIEDARWDDLPQWLRSSSGIYWIVGKAGSGKSTLMKYLHTQSLTRSFLVEWAKGERLHVCNYFFSNLGTTEQKSLEGLSRTLLYQILSIHRDMISQVLPYMWRQIHDTESGNAEDIDLPSVAETTQAFKVLASNAPKLGKFCFLVDGLDEFVGNLMDGIAFLRNLASDTRVKIIVSSRPIPECVASFGKLPGLHLQDLNQADIKLYVSEVLGGQDYMKKLVARYPEEGQGLLNEVIKKSSGVFLWVVLACRSLISGFAAHDRIAEMRRRVNELPPELEDMFQLMLSKIDKRHREQGARLLKTCYTFHNTPLGDEEAGSFYTLGLALTEAYYSDFRPIYNVPEEEKKDLCLELEGRLRSRCGGLLEVDTTSAGCLCAFERGKHNPVIDSRMVFMHRSVFEFLRDETVWDLGVLRLAEDDGYDVATALSLYSLYVAKQSMASGNRTAGPDPCNIFWNGLLWTVLADSEPRGDSALFLDNMYSVLMSLKPRSSDRGKAYEFVRSLLRSTNQVAHRGDPAYISFTLAIHLQAVSYVRKHLDSYIQANHHQRRCGCPPLLRLAIDRLLSPLSPSPIGTVPATAQISSIDIHSNDLSRTRTIVRLLLNSGCDPNERTSAVVAEMFVPGNFVVMTPWTIFVGWVRRQDFKRLSAAVKITVLDMLEDFIRAKADLRHLKFDPLGWVDTILVLDNNSSGPVAEKARSVRRLLAEGLEHLYPMTAVVDTSPTAGARLAGGKLEESETQAHQAIYISEGHTLQGSPAMTASAIQIPNVGNLAPASWTKRFKGWVKKHT